VFAYILLIASGPTHALRTPIGILLFEALIALGVYILRLQTLAEFTPDAMLQREEFVASLGAALMSYRPSFGSAYDDSSVVAQIERLQGLRSSGAISDEEFQRAKEKVLA
jgi:Short C-terminal domain